MGIQQTRNCYCFSKTYIPFLSILPPWYIILFNLAPDYSISPSSASPLASLPVRQCPIRQGISLEKYNNCKLKWWVVQLNSVQRPQHCIKPVCCTSAYMALIITIIPLSTDWVDEKEQSYGAPSETYGAEAGRGGGWQARWGGSIVPCPWRLNCVMKSYWYIHTHSSIVATWLYMLQLFCNTLL